MITKLWRRLTRRYHTAIVTIPETIAVPARMTESDVRRVEDEMQVFGNLVRRGLRELGYAPGSMSVGNHFGRLHAAMPVRLGRGTPEDLIVEMGRWMDIPLTTVRVYDEEY